jgi:hypothetical protein
MPEEFPSDRDTQGAAASAAGGRSGNYSETPNNSPAPAAPGAVIDPAAGAEAGGNDPGTPGLDANAGPDEPGDAGVPSAADAGGLSDGTP